MFATPARAGLALLSLLAPALATAVAVTGPAAPAQAASGADLSFGTFNVVTVSADPGATGERGTWRQRRSTIVNQVLTRGIDVLGVQEVNQSSIYGGRLVDDKRNQYQDLLAGLNRAGGAYRLTSAAPYNCVKASSSRNCRYRYRAASGDNRILYDTRTVALKARGAYKYPHQVRGKNARYLAWGLFTNRATGRDFLFTTTHLDPYSKTVRVQQWRDMIARVDKLRKGRPVVLTGDFNTSKFAPWAAKMLPAMSSHGYPDTFGQRYHQAYGVRRAQSQVHSFVNSFNRWRRDVPSYSYWEDRFSSSPRIGNGVDWIFASSGLTVRQVEVVVDVDESSGRVVGTIPSDHQMLRATIALP